MNCKKFYVVGVVFFLTVAGLLSLQSGASSQEGCVTGQCHAKMLKAGTVHPAAYSCESCHMASGTPHPQKNKKTFQLMQQVPDLCYMCHAAFGQKPHVHPPVKDGMCMTCHDPHESAEPKLLAQPASSLCMMCHPDKVEHKYVHGPASTGDCVVCHNPHESGNDSLVLATGPELCFNCHVDMSEEMKKKVVHPALYSGCTSCHSPHGSEFKKLLAAEGEKLCFQCHPVIEETIAKAKSVHPPILTEKSCASCHSPHASESEKLLPKTGKDLCLDCHKDFITKNMTVLHGPIREGRCTPCHNPHGSPYEKLLAGRFPTDFYVPYSEKEYELCFSCHNRDLLRFPDTSFATGFRDGNRNLHYVHVNRPEKGRNCGACHAIHGGSLPKLISEKVSFGKWNLPLKFKKTENGGSCAPGCHKQYSYQRKESGKDIETVPVKTDESQEKKSETD
jgi:predicted CXXCH cytochrome family protein